MRALLWDIDGTLTRSAGAGTRALMGALHAKPRSADHLRRMRLDGMTDRAIVRLLLAAEHGDASLPVEERARAVPGPLIDEVLAQYLVALERECVSKSYVAQPGIEELIPRLERRSDVVLGLCTGNLARGAELKLTATGLWERFRFGGYGSDAEARPEIVRAAWARAQAHGATEGLVIGDTPRDILAAHEAGLPACGVATGRWSLHDLAGHGAECVIESFADVGHAEKILLGPIARR
ncbi:MAG TPA: HAD family hydrolase [Myxococcales bacterium]|nr:HAD family hydrolase [Myxococcales bacterium]